MPAIRRTVRDAIGRGRLDHDGLVTLVEALLAVPVHERRTAAVEALVASVGVLGADDIALLERLLRQSHTWALVDPLAMSVVGPLVVREPALGALLDRWATDQDLWLRRAALLALLIPLRQGGGDFDRFTRYADAMLEEKEFFIRKAIGWILRDTGRRRPDLVFAWLLPHAARASGVTIREAMKPLTDAQRAAISAAATPTPDDPTRSDHPTVPDDPRGPGTGPPTHLAWDHAL